jgi:hypothetical protein
MDCLHLQRWMVMVNQLTMIIPQRDCNYISRNLYLNAESCPIRWIRSNKGIVQMNIDCLSVRSRRNQNMHAACIPMQRRLNIING